MALACIAGTDQFNCGRCKDSKALRIQWGCDEPKPKGRGIPTVIKDADGSKFEICECPRKKQPANVRAWVEAFNLGAAQSPYDDMAYMAPIFVDAMAVLSGARHDVDMASMKSGSREGSN